MSLNGHSQQGGSLVFWARRSRRRCPARGAWVARRDEGAYRQYVTAEQHRQAGCPARKMFVKSPPGTRRRHGGSTNAPSFDERCRHRRAPLSRDRGCGGDPASLSTVPRGVCLHRTRPGGAGPRPDGCRCRAGAQRRAEGRVGGCTGPGVVDAAPQRLGRLAGHQPGHAAGGDRFGRLLVGCRRADRGVAPDPYPGARAERTARYHEPAAGAGCDRRGGVTRRGATAFSRQSVRQRQPGAGRVLRAGAAGGRAAARVFICWCSEARRVPMPSTSR